MGAASPGHRRMEITGCDASDPTADAVRAFSITLVAVCGVTVISALANLSRDSLAYSALPPLAALGLAYAVQ